MHDFKGCFRKNQVQSGITLPECMTLPENFPTTISSVKLMHDCNSLQMRGILGKTNGNFAKTKGIFRKTQGFANSE